MKSGRRVLVILLFFHGSEWESSMFGVFRACCSAEKIYNLCPHYLNLNADKFDNFQGQQRKEKVDELLLLLKKQ